MKSQHSSYLSMITLFMVLAVSCASSGNETDHLALLAIKSTIKDPFGALSSWSNSLDHCDWEGIMCGKMHTRVVALNLSSRGLAGSISPYIGNLSFLHSVDLSNNTLGGPIPPEFGFLSRLSSLYLYHNLLTGKIPSNISNCLSLEYLSISQNSLVGEIPPEFSSFPTLKGLYANENSLMGPIFSAILNITSLEQLSVESNFFDGVVPDTISQMKNMVYLAAGQNLLTGMIPSSIYNLSNIEVFSFHDNQLQGSLPKDIASRFPYLQILNLADNQFTGTLPPSLSNISSLTRIELSDNMFTGEVPWNIGNLNYLQILLMRNNSLGSGEPNDLKFVSSLVNCSYLQVLSVGANNFGREFPNAIVNLSTNLISLEMDHNAVSGRIPEGMSNLFRLYWLQLQNNQLSGLLPSDIGKLQMVGNIQFAMNMFGGGVPESLGNLSMLSTLRLDGNNFQGNIPSSVGNSRNLKYLNLNQNNLSGAIPVNLFGGSAVFVQLGLAGNSLEGPLPFEVGQQVNMVDLEVNDNMLSGEIPSTIGSCSSLLSLSLQGNMFQGGIPASMGSLNSLQFLDLSHNNLSGPIPAYISKFPLTYLNLSYNKFEGAIPEKGAFANASVVSLDGNSGLCGGILELHLPRCAARKVTLTKTSNFKQKLVVSCVCSVIGVAAIVVSLYYIFHRKKTHSSLPVVTSNSDELFFKVSYKMLLKATEGFSTSNFLGAGTFGSVFRGVLEHDLTVAVKVLNLQQPGAAKSFVAECEALRNIRHRNLVGVITACSSVDYQGNDFKAIVYEFMQCGSLESWLHNSEEIRNLSLAQRVNVALDVASALEYLHHDCEVPIVHRDMKPSNVLLDSDMVAHVGDFGLAKFLPQPLESYQNSSIGVKGTIGYAAPEYGLGGDPSAEGDVYSYGILVLEMMTGKRPTDEIFKDGLNLHSFVKTALPDQAVQIVDKRLLDSEGHKILNNARIPRQAEIWMNCVVTMMKIGVACSMESPQDRINLKHSIAEISKAKDSLL